MNDVLTVSQLNRYVKSVLDGDFRLRDILLNGEISNFTNHYRSGHYYFTLKEGGCSVKAVMFQNYANDLRFEPENGMAVIVRCGVSLYERDGSYQIYVYEMQPDGQGALQVAFEQLHRKLEAKGYFAEDKKKPIPRYAQRIGVVTSETGAALQDVINIVSRRSPMSTLVLAPALVQGEGAEESLCSALETLDNQGNCDVIIVTRGGGSMEDLWCFNSEKLVKTIYDCKTPIISAVGHEVDFTLCDYAADMRAPTPSAAAELASEDGEELSRRLELLRHRIERQAKSRLDQGMSRFEGLMERRCFANPDEKIENYAKQLEYFSKAIQNCIKNGIIKRQEQLMLQRARLEALNPLARLAGGYSMTMKDGRKISSVREVSPGERLSIRLYDGIIDAQILGTRPGEGMRKWQKN